MLNFPRWKITLVMLACIGFCLLAVPNILSTEQRQQYPWLPTGAVNLGLDLQGGSHLLLELDYSQYFEDQLHGIIDDLRVKLRSQNIGYTNLSVQGQKITVTPIGNVDMKAVVKEVADGLEVTQNGASYDIAFSEDYTEAEKRKLLEQSIEIVDRRINETGTLEPIIQRQGNERILVQVPGMQNPEKLKEMLGRTAKMTFHMVDMDVPQTDLQAGRVPPGDMLLPSDGREKLSNGQPMKFAIQRRVLLSGDMLENAAPTFENGEPVISFRFNTAGTKKFGEITSNNVGKLFAIVLDGKVITAPVIRTPITGGSGIISGSFTTESANELSLLLRAGALPVPLKVVEERTVGPSLGVDSIESGKKSCIIGVLLVMGFMLWSYGLFGLIANVALVMNLIMIFAALSLFGATLTLPGIAGIVLTLGMAVDANVLIYERIREETRNGKTPIASVDAGFRMAFGTIIDSHLTTLMAALLLYQFGTGSVKGFAVTLAVGIITSLFSATTLTRLMVAVWMKRRRPKVIPI